MDSTAATYTYSGALRVKKVQGATTTVYIFSGTKVIAEYVNGALSKEYVYSGSALLATHEGVALKYHHSDHLSTRVETDGTTAATVRTFGHFPFGEVWYETGSANKWKFTTYERDAESGLDQAVFRYNSPRLGRFMTADILAGYPANPQSLNRYSYSGNDPVNLTDPLGLVIAPCDAQGHWYCPGEDDGDGDGGAGGSHPTPGTDQDLLPDGGGVEGVEEQIQTKKDITDNREVLRILFCLWAKGGYGHRKTERALWLTEKQGTFGAVDWPWSAEPGRERWGGPKPDGRIAIAHTHSNSSSPKPSSTDHATATKEVLPVYVVTTNAIWKAAPGSKTPTQVQESGWTKGFDEKKDCPK